MTPTYLQHRAAVAVEALAKATTATAHATAEREALQVKAELEKFQRDAAFTGIVKATRPQVMLARRSGG